MWEALDAVGVLVECSSPMPESSDAVPTPIWQELFKAATELAAMKPWEFASDGDLFGLTDPVTNKVRIGHILGNAGMVFGAVIYRDRGIGWLLATLQGDFEQAPDSAIESMDCIKLEWVVRGELSKTDKEALALAGYKAKGRGPIWPQFRSSQPGWYPREIEAAEAKILVGDLKQLTVLLRIFKADPSPFNGRSLSEIPFLGDQDSKGALCQEDVEWLTLVLSPEHGQGPIEPLPAELFERLKKLSRAKDRSVEFDARVLPGISLMEDGKPCFARMSLLVASDSGFVESFDVQPATSCGPNSAQLDLAALLLKIEFLPGQLLVARGQRHAGIEILCKRLGIGLKLVRSLPLVDEAFDALGGAARRGGGDE